MKKIRPDILILCAVLAIGIFLRFQGLLTTNLGNMLPDEGRIGLGAATIVQYKTFLFTYESPHEPPLALYYPIPFMMLFGKSLWVLKLAPIIFGLGAIVMTYLFSKELFSRRVAAVASLFLAVLPFAVEYSRTLYEHSFVPFFSAGALYFFARYLKKGKSASLYAFAAFSGLGCSTHIVFLFFLFAIFVAALASGPAFRPHIGLRSRIIAFAIFILCAVPFICLLVFSSNLPGILSSSGGLSAIASFDTAWHALRERMALANGAFTTMFWLGMSAWVSVLILSDKREPAALFLMLFCGAVIVVGVLTVAGMNHEYHLLVMLPMAVTIPASLVDLPAGASPKIATAVACVAAAALLFFAVTVTIPQIKSAQTRGPLALDAALEKLDPDSTIAPQKDITMLHKYLHFKETGKLPDFHTITITSLDCNSFRRCPSQSVFPDIDFLFREALPPRGSSKSIPWNAYSDPSFFTQERILILRGIILDAIQNKGYSTFILSRNQDPAHPHTIFCSRVRNILQELAREGLITIHQTSYSTHICDYDLLRVAPAPEQ